MDTCNKQHNYVHREPSSGQDLMPLATKSAAIAAGAVIALELYRHRRLLAVTGAFTAALLWTNKTLKTHANSGMRHYKKIYGAPSFAGEAGHPASQKPMDALDEALMESFPASDPPASYRR